MLVHELLHSEIHIVEPKRRRSMGRLCKGATVDVFMRGTRRSFWEAFGRHLEENREEGVGAGRKFLSVETHD